MLFFIKWNGSMFDDKYDQKCREHAAKVTETIDVINYLLDKNPALNNMNVKVKRTTETEIKFVEMQWESMSERRAGWSWRAVLGKKKKKIMRLALSICSNGQVYGMLFCTGSRHGLNVNIRYLEGDPNKWHPLKSFILDIALEAAEQYAEKLNAKMLTIQSPVPELVDTYRDKGYDYNQKDRRRYNKGLSVFCKTLEKVIRNG
ncbi:hypothetical protein D9K10_14065 [Escherichia coli]|nr:hypothetical protein [Escherichia coli]GDG47905.1 hypothetical protein BvCmsKSNP016_01830 [Escherichia coli]